MGKYEELYRDVLSIFGTTNWVAEGVKTVPSNYTGVDSLENYIRVHLIPSGLGINRRSVTGVLLIDIFTTAGGGPIDAAVIADKLDKYLISRSKRLTKGTIQFLENSSMSSGGKDKDNTALFRSAYTLSFNYFGDE